MAEYIDREKLIEHLHNAEENYKADHDYEVDDDPFSDGILSAMFSVNQIVGSEPTAIVVERSKIDKAIDEIDFLRQHRAKYITEDNKICIDSGEVIKILKNIGE